MTAASSPTAASPTTAPPAAAAPAPDDEFLAVARQALGGPHAGSALDQLGWWDLLTGLDHDADTRPAVLAVFRAQGATLAATPALGAVLAQPYLAAAGLGPDTGRVVAPVPLRSSRRGEVAVAVGDLRDCRLLIDRPGVGATIVAPTAVGLRPLDRPGRLPLHEVSLDAELDGEVVLDDDACAAARVRATFLGRTAAALEILGAAEAAVGLAVDYAGQRHQFGEPIGHFQAVRHLLAWARTDCEAIAAVTAEALRLDTAAPRRWDEVAKALAGRNGRRACERALQVLGGIGFTAEHDHHHLHGRVLTLDALLGSSAQLTAELGAGLRRSGVEPGFTATLLTGADRYRTAP